MFFDLPFQGYNMTFSQYTALTLTLPRVRMMRTWRRPSCVRCWYFSHAGCTCTQGEHVSTLSLRIIWRLVLGALTALLIWKATPSEYDHYASPALPVSDQKRTRSQYHSIKHARPPLSKAWCRRQNKTKNCANYNIQKILQILKTRLFESRGAIGAWCLAMCVTLITYSTTSLSTSASKMQGKCNRKSSTSQHHHSKGPCPLCHL